MAPSPTGEFHIGSMRTLLYNWAFARKHQGRFVLRIEDTDRERFVDGAEDRTKSVIRDYGLTWDEGPDVDGPHKPYKQSERLDIYQRHVGTLLDKGVVYRCFCGKETLEKMREVQVKKGITSPKYDRRCLGLSEKEIKGKLRKGEKCVIRLKVPENRKITFADIVLGNITINSEVLDDQVLIKSDGFPTYHFAVVVDDHLMHISHVIRGNEWLPSTPKHVLLYEAFGWEIPVYAHLPNLKEVGANKKMSKRFGDVSARGFLEKGYLPEALLNFLMLLGWNPGTDREFFTLEEFVENFSLERVHKTDLVAFDRDKLLWMNGEYIKKSRNDTLKIKIYDFYDVKFDEKILEKTTPLVKERMKLLSDYQSLAGFFYQKPEVDREQLGNDWKLHLEGALKVLRGIKEWKLGNINDALTKLIDKKDFKTGKFFMDLRIAITGNKVTPPINESLVILGRKETLERLQSLIS